MRSNSIGGLNTINSTPGSSWGKYSESCSSTACMLDKVTLIDSLKACNAQIALENLSNKRGIDVEHSAALQLRKLAGRDMSQGILHAAKYYDLITACLEEGAVRHYKKSELKNLGLLSEIVNLSHSNDVMQSPMSLTDVCKYLDAGQASLYRICQEYFGMGIIEMMMQVRLEESKGLLRQKIVRNRMKQPSVKLLFAMDLSMQVVTRGGISPVLASFLVKLFEFLAVCAEAWKSDFSLWW